MLSKSVRNVWLISKREYLQSLRGRLFIISTLVIPLILALGLAAPALMSSPTTQTRRLVIVCPQRQLARAIGSRLSGAGSRYQVELNETVSDRERARLNSEVQNLAIDGYVWLDDESVTSGGATYVTRGFADLEAQRYLRSVLSSALIDVRLARFGISADDSRRLLQGVDLQIAPLDNSRPNPGAGNESLVTAMVFVFVLYFSILSYGAWVMRSVLDEKTSRVGELLLVAASPEQLIAGKLLGVGALGLTQLAVWAVMLIGFAAGRDPAYLAGFTAGRVVSFVCFFVLGYLFYSSIFGALGAAFNSQEEAQHWTLLVVAPLVATSALVVPVLRAPDAGLSVALSLFPLCAPVLMYVRIAIAHPPAWQVAVSAILLIASIGIGLAACARIYRVGMLMYGKRPTLAELLKWIRYADA